MGRRLVALFATVGIGCALVVSGAAPAASSELPSLTVGDVNVVEGDAGSALIAVPVDLSSPPLVTTTVTYSVRSDTAIAGNDFVARTGKLTFKPGVASLAVSVGVYGDTTPEGDDHVTVELTTPVNASVADGLGGVTISDDDTDGVATRLEVSIGDVDVTEADSGAHYAVIPITLSRAATSKVVVHFDVDCGSATLGADYSMPASGNVTFALGQRSKGIKFTVLADVTPEDFVQNIKNTITVRSGPAVVNSQEAVSEIVDDDTTVAPPPPVWLGHIERVNVGNDEQEAEQPPACLSTMGTSSQSISGDGRYTLFSSPAANLVAGDTNDLVDAFVRDRVAGTTERVSVAPDGSQFESTNSWAGGARGHDMSDDGRFVLFESGAGTGQNMYVRDRLLQTTTSVGKGYGGSISDDGQKASTAHYEYDTVQNAAISVVALIDVTTGTSTLVDYRSPEFVDPWQRNWGVPRISGDGRSIAFTDANTNVVAGDTNACADTFLYDTVSHSYERVSLTNAGAQQQNTSPIVQCSYGSPSITADGRYVAFDSAAWNQFPGATSSADLGAVNGAAPSVHSYVRDRLLGTTQLVDPTDTPHPAVVHQFTAMTDDGRYLFYVCACGPVLVAQPWALDGATFRRDRLTGATDPIGVSDDGVWPVNDTGTAAGVGVSGVSDDGLVALFTSAATNLSVSDLNGQPDVFVEDLR